MITDAIHDYVAGQLSRLWSLPKPQRRARLAELRRGVGHQPGDLPALWGSFLQELPKELWGRETAAGECREPSEAEWAVYLALTLYALHQQGEENVSINEKGCTLGRAVRLLAQNSAAAAQDWTGEQRPTPVQRTGHSGFHARGVPLPPGGWCSCSGEMNRS